MPQRLTIRRYNPATGNLDVIGPDKQADQQVSHIALRRAVDTARENPLHMAINGNACMYPDS